MVTIAQFHVSKAQLEKLSEKDLALFLGSTKLFNELSIGTKHFLFAIESLKKGGNDAERHADFAFLSYAIRMLAGHLHEFSRFIEARVHAKDLQNLSTPTLDVFLEKKIRPFKAYFSKSNIVSDIRKKLSFHTDVDVLLKAFDVASDAFEFEIFIGSDAPPKGHVGQHLYGGADVLTFGSIFHLPSKVDLTKCLLAFSNEILTLANDAMGIFSTVAVYMVEEKLRFQTYSCNG